ncbi:MAG: iron chelate uptake ABC transporter family permease subunit, partial [Oscillospiraceae bacterium]|nr:iron chelate uptake ABC transporter family permease subunit [Oscillospiraceae bacterium]
MEANTKLLKREDGYSRYIWKKWLILVSLAIILFLTILISLSVGSSGIPITEIIRVLLGGGEAVSRTIVLSIRMPRIATGIAVGIA